MKKATYYHAGCAVCVEGQNFLLTALDRNQCEIEQVNLGQSPSRIDEAEKAGVQSLPALVLDGKVFHINFGAKLADIKREASVGVAAAKSDEREGPTEEEIMAWESNLGD